MFWIDAVAGASPLPLHSTLVRAVLTCRLSPPPYSLNHQSEFHVCPISPFGIATQECFDGNPLEFVSDPLTGGVKHDAYPERAYLAPSANTLHYIFKVSKKLYIYTLRTLSHFINHHIHTNTLLSLILPSFTWE